MKFREHRGGLAESMETVKEFSTKQEFFEYLTSQGFWHPFLIPKTFDDYSKTFNLKIEPYGYDERIGWDTYIVVLEGYGVLGFTDGPVE